MCLYCEGKVSNCSIKAVVGVSWPMKELSKHIKSHIRENCLSSHSCHLVKIQIFNHTPLCVCPMCLHCIEKVSNFSIQSCGRRRLAHEGTTYAYTKTILGKIVYLLIAVIWSFFKKPNSFMHMFIASTLYRQSIKFLHQKLW